jgi:hypothetical protein
MTKYAEALAALSAAGVRFLVVGVFGINLHADRDGPVIFTEDCDLLLPADSDTLARAIACLRGLGCAIEAGGEPLPDEDEAVIRGIVRQRACVRAVGETVAFDLPLQVAGMDFEALWARRRCFDLGGVEVSVGSVEDLLTSKRIANRPKDRLFLEIYRSELDQLRRRDANRSL